MEKNEDDDKRILDDKYIIEHRVGSGGEGVAYLVKEKEHPNSEKKFIAKIIEFDGHLSFTFTLIQDFHFLLFFTKIIDI